MGHKNLPEEPSRSTSVRMTFIAKSEVRNPKSDRACRLQNYKLESSLWTALKSKQGMESELSELRWHAGIGTQAQATDGGPRRASTPPQLPAFDAVAFDRHAMSEGAQVERKRKNKKGVREMEGTESMQ